MPSRKKKPVKKVVEEEESEKFEQLTVEMKHSHQNDAPKHPKKKRKQKKTKKNTKSVKPEAEEDGDDETLSVADGTTQDLIFARIIKKYGDDSEPDSESSLLLDESNESLALLRNTAINSFGPGETLTESKIRKKMMEIKQREKENIKGIKLQKALQKIVLSEPKSRTASGGISLVNILSGDSDSEEDEAFLEEGSDDDEELNVV